MIGTDIVSGILKSKGKEEFVRVLIMTDLLYL